VNSFAPFPQGWPSFPPGHQREGIAAHLPSVRPERIPETVDLDSMVADNGSMKTTVDIPENELKDAMRFTKAKTKREAVVRVLEEFNRRRRMAELVKYSGTFDDRFPTNEEIEAVDAMRDLGLHGRRSRR
jgi:Uncharacterized protein conserved in bacteria (DUF2191).